MERARTVQLALALALAALLGVETYALFDDDLGTPVPLFHEWTCRGELDVVALDGFGRPDLRVPASGLNATARWAGEFVPAYFRAYHREAGGEWVELPPARDERGWHIFFLEKVTLATQAYVVGRDLSGKRCEGVSTVIGAIEEPRTVVPTPTPPLEPTPPAPTATPTPPSPDPVEGPACADVVLTATNPAGEAALTVPETRLRATVDAPKPTGEGVFTLYVSDGGDFAAAGTAQGVEATFTLATTGTTRAFVHVDFRPAFECVKDSSVLRVRAD